MKENKFLVGAIIFAIASFLLDSIASEAALSVQHPILTYFMNWFTNLNSLVIVLVIVTSLFLWEERKKKWIKVVLLSFIASAMFSMMVKLLIARPRPGLYEGFLFSQYSFPSMHAAIAFSLVPVLDKKFPKLKWFWIVFALLIAISRLYLGVHYLSDVVWGAIAGYVIGSVMVKLQDKKMLERWIKILH